MLSFMHALHLGLSFFFVSFLNFFATFFASFAFICILSFFFMAFFTAFLCILRFARFTARLVLRATRAVARAEEPAFLASQVWRARLLSWTFVFDSWMCFFILSRALRCLTFSPWIFL